MVLMNKKGQVQFYAYMVGLVIFILALALAYPIRQAADTAMSSQDCTNESLDGFGKINCYATDLVPFYFVGSLIFIAGIWFTAKVVFG